VSTLVDSNVLIDVLSQDPRWFAWSSEALAHAAEQSVICINPVSYAEVSVGYATAAALEAALPVDYFIRESLPFETGFLAGRAFVAYRRRGACGRRPCRISISARTRWRRTIRC
jgi:predicted nucleic acid-binding protein